MEPSCSSATQSSRSSPTMAAKQDGNASSETSFVQSSENAPKRNAEKKNADVFSARSEEYRLLFRLPSDEVLVKDFNCALQENILLQGHIYLFVHHICFYSNIFGFQTKKIIAFHEVTCVRKAKTAAIFPNAIEIVAGGKKHFFGSFLSRDEAYRLIVDGWAQHASDSRSILEPQALKSETSIQGIENAIAERERGFKRVADDLSSSGRRKDASSGECTPLPNPNIDSSLSSKQVQIFENREENAEHHVLVGPFSLQCEDVKAPKVPEHFAMVVQAKFSVCVEEFSNLFFSDQASNFLEHFHKRCGDKDFQCASWRQHEQFGYIRDVSFLHPIKIYPGAKYWRCQEVQKFRVYRNSHLMVETSQQIADVPFADYFLVEGIWDVQKIGNEENGCIVRVYSNVAFSKKIFRGKIEQSTKEECREVYDIWIQIAHELLKQNEARQEGSSAQDICRIQDNDVRLRGSELGETSEKLHQTISLEMQELSDVDYLKPQIEDAVQERLSWPNFRISIIRETCVASISYLKSENHLLLVLVFVGLAAALILMQMSNIVLLTRAPDLHVVTRGSSIGGSDWYGIENIEWLEKRFNYLKEEMVMVETRLEKLHHEHAILKKHLQSFEQTKHKS